MVKQKLRRGHLEPIDLGQGLAAELHPSCTGIYCKH